MSDAAVPRDPIPIQLYKIYHWDTNKPQDPVKVLYAAHSDDENVAAEFIQGDIGSYAKELLGIQEKYDRPLKPVFVSWAVGSIDEHTVNIPSPLGPADIKELAEELRKELAGRIAPGIPPLV